MDESTLRVHVVAPEVPGKDRLDQWGELTQLAAIDGVALDVCGGPGATRQAVVDFVRRPCDVLVWSGHGGPNRLDTADGLSLDGEDLATYAKGALARVVVLMACLSGATDEDLDSLVETLSQEGLTTVGMLVSVRDRAAIAFNVEFIRALAAGASLARAFRTGRKQMRAVSADCAANVILMPGINDGMRALMDRMDGMDRRLVMVERKVDDVLVLLDQRRNGTGVSRGK